MKSFRILILGIVFIGLIAAILLFRTPLVSFLGTFALLLPAPPIRIQL